MVAIRGCDWLTPPSPRWPERRGAKPKTAARPLSDEPWVVTGVVCGRVARAREHFPASSRAASYVVTYYNCPVEAIQHTEYRTVTLTRADLPKIVTEGAAETSAAGSANSRIYRLPLGYVTGQARQQI